MTPFTDLQVLKLSHTNRAGHKSIDYIPLYEVYDGMKGESLDDHLEEVVEDYARERHINESIHYDIIEDVEERIKALDMIETRFQKEIERKMKLRDYINMSKNANTNNWDYSKMVGFTIDTNKYTKTMNTINDVKYALQSVIDIYGIGVTNQLKSLVDSKFIRFEHFGGTSIESILYNK